MPNHEQQYLQAMGIQSWDLIHPERLQGYQPKKAALDTECKLLLVSTNYPTASEAALFERVLKSFNVELQQSQYASLHNLANIDLSTLEWIWFAGCDDEINSNIKKLHTPLLSDVDGNTQHRRDLWQQICSYEAK
ncbi:DNA polymerase III subunit psi [Vibrio ziniensis]|uniref:DNA polymerase III subunit psi n=1 Tax=Vibrio ziniensis TaxID=2711221 RepID=A0A6G7CKG7_9VIBR|nr:DNA polymerase III subunit psi [Vibrio ziniensis]QIH42605.1 DNA polymerase III subunit psi [Vibrio ziniensis]